MNKRNFLVLAAALGFGVIGGIMILNFLREAASPKARLVIARNPISEGQVITESDLGLSDPTKRADAEDYFLQPADVVRQQALENISRGALIHRSKVKRPPPEPKSMEPKKDVLPIPKGMRAFSISQGDIADLPDLLEIGSYADGVGLVEQVDGKTEMKTLFQGRQVLFVDSLDSSKVRSITLAIHPQEVESVIKATSLGKIRLVIRLDAGEFTSFEASSGVIEIIRGIEKERKAVVEL